MVHTMTQAEAYDVLEIEFDSSKEDVKRAYKRKALETHPDKGSGDHASFLRVSEAYKRLTDPDSFKDEIDGNEDDDNEDDDDEDDDDYGYRVMVDPSEMEAMFNVMFGAGEASFSFGSAFADAAEDMHAFGHRGAGVGGSISRVAWVQMMRADEGIFMGDGNDEAEDEEEDDEDYEDEVEGGWRSMMYRRMAAAHGHDDDDEEDDEEEEDDDIDDDEGSEGDESDDEYDEEEASDDDGDGGGGRRGHGMDGMDVAELLMAQLLLGGPLGQLGQVGALGPMGAAGSRADLGAMDPMAALAQHLGGPRGGGAGEGARLHSAFYRGPRAAAQSGSSSSSSRRGGGGGGGGGGAHASERVEELDSADDEWETEDEDGDEDEDDDQWETESEGEGERDKGSTRPPRTGGAHTHTGRSGSLAK
jgi:curved DNA-binding protein CbpA